MIVRRAQRDSSISIFRIIAVACAICVLVYFIFALVAGFVYGYLKSNDYKQAFIYGVCTGSASAFSEELATKPEVEALIDKWDSASN